MRNIKKLTFAILLFAAIFTSPAKAQQSNLNCDSTCVLQQQSMLALIPKANTFVAPTYVASPTPKPKCGPSAGSILPGAPNSFLCGAGAPSAVSTTTANGETTYQWTCSNSLGTQSCMANQREVGACGSDSGQTLSSNPTNVCATGQSYGFNFANNQYTWGCAGNYGSPAYCSAAYAPPITTFTKAISVCRGGYGWENAGCEQGSATLTLANSTDTKGTIVFNLLGYQSCNWGEPSEGPFYSKNPWTTNNEALAIRNDLYNGIMRKDVFDLLVGYSFFCNQTGG